MKYMGSKNRHSKEILNIVLSEQKGYEWYVEPFAGGFNIIDKVSGIKRLGNDINEYVVSMFRAVTDYNWTPPDYISEDEYKHIKDNKDMYTKYLVGFVGIGCSYSGKWFGGYARGNDSRGIPRNYCKESKNNLLKQASRLKGTFFSSMPYNYLNIENSIIYCDPPYRGTTKYKDSLDYDEFYVWCRNMKGKGNLVFVSEYDMPADFKCVWSKVVNNTLVKNTGAKQGIERLFTL